MACRYKLELLTSSAAYCQSFRYGVSYESSVVNAVAIDLHWNFAKSGASGPWITGRPALIEPFND